MALNRTDSAQRALAKVSAPVIFEFTAALNPSWSKPHCAKGIVINYLHVVCVCICECFMEALPVSDKEIDYSVTDIWTVD